MVELAPAQAQVAPAAVELAPATAMPVAELTPTEWTKHSEKPLMEIQRRLDQMMNENKLSLDERYQQRYGDELPQSVAKGDGESKEEPEDEAVAEPKPKVSFKPRPKVSFKPRPKVELKPAEPEADETESKPQKAITTKPDKPPTARKPRREKTAKSGKPKAEAADDDRPGLATRVGGGIKRSGGAAKSAAGATAHAVGGGARRVGGGISSGARRVGGGLTGGARRIGGLLRRKKKGDVEADGEETPAKAEKGDQPPQQDYSSLKITELKDLLREKGLRITGNKAELVKRLEKA